MDRRTFLAASGGAVGAGLAESAAAQTTAAETLRRSGEIRAALDPVDPSFDPGDPRRYGAAGDGSVDDTGAVQQSLSTLQRGVITPNPRLNVSPGQYRLTATAEVPDSASQFDWCGASRPRATQLLWDGGADLPMVRLTNTREALVAALSFDRSGSRRPSHCVLQDRNSDTQLERGGVGYVQYRDCRFARAATGVAITQSGVGTNDNNAFFRCEFVGNAEFGLHIDNTNAAWTDVDECRFDGNGFADISNVVRRGALRGGSFVARQCRHISGQVAYEIGASRSISIIAPRVEQQATFLRTADSKRRSKTIAASASEGAFLDAEGGLPEVAAGDYIWVRGFADGANNGVFQAVGTPSSQRIPVAGPLVAESAGRTVELAPTRCRTSLHKRGVHVMVFGGEILTKGPISLLFDGDEPRHTLTLVNCDYQASGGRFEFPGAATINIIGGSYAVSEIRYNGRLNLIGTVQAAGRINLVNLGSGQLRLVENVGGGLDVPRRLSGVGSKPSVDGWDSFVTANAAPARISGFCHGFTGKVIALRAGDGLTTLEPDPGPDGLRLTGGVPVTLSPGQTIRFVRLEDGRWQETGELAAATLPSYDVRGQTTRRHFDPSRPDVKELADVLGTLITDLKNRNLLG